jgi:hypothetical protein
MSAAHAYRIPADEDTATLSRPLADFVPIDETDRRPAGQAPSSVAPIMGPPNRAAVDIMGSSDGSACVDVMGGPDRGPRLDIMGGPDQGPRLNLMGQSDLRYVDSLFTGRAG